MLTVAVDISGYKRSKTAFVRYDIVQTEKLNKQKYGIIHNFVAARGVR